MTFKKVDPKKKYSEMEKEILSFWKEKNIFEKSIENRPESKLYSFYDGPPFATGTPHYGHIVASAIKDVVPRYWTMKGYRIPRKWGWDCHGLPIENIAEKELGIKQKKEIEALGVEKFNETCRSKVLTYADQWKTVIERLGRWADMENSYRTMDKDFMESVWWVFKELYDRDLVYEDYRSMHICPRCETTLSQSEVAEGYKDVKDLSVVAKFELASEPGTFILAWTTTPWTLIGNVALAVGEEIDYLELNVELRESNVKENYILAKDRIDSIVKIIGTDVGDDVISELKKGSTDFFQFEHNNFIKTSKIVKGKDLIGKLYKPLFDYYTTDKELKNRENGWKIYGGDFVSTEEGTGIVHIAPAFGEDDMNLGKKHNLPFIQHVGMDGVIRPEAGEFAGMNVKPIGDTQKTDVEIIKYLAKKNLLFAKEKYEHSYPHCWRCDTPLLNYATSSWFVSVLKIKEKILETAKEINWSPEHIKEGRWGNWLEGARDWSISRQRYWASAIPIWKCENISCGNIKVLGSIRELEDLSGEKIEDLHKHIVDKITFKCEKCEGEMKRIPDVLDCWFESGSMPYAQLHYPFENKEEFEKSFPANFIAEGVDQTRAWFYYLHVIAAGIKKQKAFGNVVVNGIVLAEDGKKMSKRLNNYPDPMEMIEKYGADILRFYLLSSPVLSAENLNFSEKELAELARGIFRMLQNTYSFFVMYANIDGFESQKSKVESPSSLLDKWIVSELNILIKNFNQEMESYHLNRAARLFPKFIDDLSNWYVRRSRKRFWKSENDADKNEAYATLHHVLVTLSKIMAPFCPFISEEIFRNLTGVTISHPERSEGSKDFSATPQNDIISVHLADFPVADENLIDEKLSAEMAKVREIVSAGLQLRAAEKIKVRQPLSKLKIKNENLKTEMLEIIKEELNVKNVEISDIIDNNSEVWLDTEITPELKLEGVAREVIRVIQEMRKEAGYEVDNRIRVKYITESEVFEKFSELIKKETLADEVAGGEIDGADIQKEFIIEKEKFAISLKKNAG